MYKGRAGEMTQNNQNRKTELLAPAGSYEAFRAVIAAGADAVYLGGSRFGARAYADNLSEPELLAAIDEAHVHGRQVYLTVNTLLKEDELMGQLYDYLLPYYEQGLDAVILQDMGVLSFVRREFPGLSIHTSTQMTITGCEGAGYLKSLGASRIVTAREMSFAEIREIHEQVDVEIESFVHGALCYSYSGQCLFSSMLGGRSGNRGRCAQPCRLPYEVFSEDRKHKFVEQDGRFREKAGHRAYSKNSGSLENEKNAVRGRSRRENCVSGKKGAEGTYILSPRDLCTIDVIPQLVESGVFSFKIEGRMKQAEYAAGAVSVYRSCLDRYLDGLNGFLKTAGTKEAYRLAREAYAVRPEESRMLFDLGSRSGFTDGYYVRQNGKEMITFGKPNHARGDGMLQQEIRETIFRSELKEKINGNLRLSKGLPAKIELQYGDIAVQAEGEAVQEAVSQPLSIEKAETCIRKTGNTPFEFAGLEIRMDSDIFLPVQALNQLRRNGLKKLTAELTERHRRTKEQSGSQTVLGSIAAETADIRTETAKACEDHQNVKLSVSVESHEQLAEILLSPIPDEIYLDSSLYSRENLFQALTEDVRAIHAKEKKAYYVLPSVFRNRTAAFYRNHAKTLEGIGLDGFAAKSIDAAAFIRNSFATGTPLILDHSLYTFNHEAKQMLSELAPIRDTVPLELNKKEITGRNNGNSEQILYGFLPLMTSAQCVHANMGRCDRTPGLVWLKDRYGKYFPVKNHCAECYNTVYNSTPLMLFQYRREFSEMGIANFRLSFTTEHEKEVRNVLKLYEDVFRNGREIEKDSVPDYTNGHYKRGVE